LKIILLTNLSTSVCSGFGFDPSPAAAPPAGSVDSKAEEGRRPKPAKVRRLLGSRASRLTFSRLRGPSSSSTGEPALVGLACPEPATKTDANLPLGLLGLARPKWSESLQREDPLGEGVRSSGWSEADADEEKLGILTGPGRRLGERESLWAGELGRRCWVVVVGSTPTVLIPGGFAKMTGIGQISGFRVR